MMASGRGGAREGAGRPRKEAVRGQHQIRAYPDEWGIIQRLARIVKHGDRKACEEFLARMESKTE